MKDLNSCAQKHLEIHKLHIPEKAWVQAKAKITQLEWKVNEASSLGSMFLHLGLVLYTVNL